jgi:hypothetical protein
MKKILQTLKFENFVDSCFERKPLGAGQARESENFSRNFTRFSRETRGERSSENFESDKGFALLVSIITTSILLIISFVVVNIALKQLIISSSYEASQYAFYVADSGVECAMYWDLKNPTNPTISAFATSTPGSVTCNGQTVTTGSQTVPTIPTQSSQIGGGGVGNPISIFSITFGNSCAIIIVTKNANGTTRIDSHGYNTCSSSAPRRYERGVTTTY